MGAKSTVDISRAEAIARIMELLQRASDQAVGRALEELNDDAKERGDWEGYLGLNNFWVTG